MAVVELGTWNVRAGYIGDTHCSHSLRALQCIDYPAITDITSMLLTSSHYSCNRHVNRAQQQKEARTMHASTQQEQSFAYDQNNGVHVAEDNNVNKARMHSRQHYDKLCNDNSYLAGSSSNDNDNFLSLWSLSSYWNNKDAHHAYVHRIHREVLRCAANDPLLLVVPEEWWLTAHHKTLASLCESLLETGHQSNEENSDGDDNHFCAEGNISAIYCMRPSVCWTLASGLTSAIVLDVGHSHSTVAAVLDGYTLGRSVQSSPIAGYAVSCAMQSLLPMETLSSLSRACTSLPQLHNNMSHLCKENKKWMMEIMSSVTHIYGYVHNSVADTPKELKESIVNKEKSTYELPLNNGMWMMPDGHSITLSDYVRWAPYELLFCKRDNECHDNNCNSKQICDSSCVNNINVAEMMAECKAQMDVEWQLHGIHHLLAGGCGCNSVNFYHRLIDELKNIDSAYYRYDRDGFMHSAPNDTAAWVGASMAAESSALEPLWITNSEYDECGDEVLFRKLFL